MYICINIMSNKNYFQFTLNNQQSKIFEELKGFSNNQDNVFILKGYAGTGKTTLMSGFIKYLKENKKNFQLLSSTGRAAKILSDKTGMNASTIHSQIYTFNGLSEDLEEMYDNQVNKVEDSGQISLVFGLTQVTSEKTILYIIDEASMISDKKSPSSSFARFGDGDLLSDLLKYDKKGKFLFLGDPCQLPPINQASSPALSGKHMVEKHNKFGKEFELTQIMRQDENNGILKAAGMIRKYYEIMANTKWPKIPLKNKENISIVQSQAGLIINYVNTIKKKGKEYATFLCQTNKQCRDINNIIRTMLFADTISLNIGELLLVTQNCQLVDLVNGDLVEIEKIGKEEYRCGLNFINVQVIELASKKSYTLLLIKDILTSSTTNISDKQHKDLMIDYYLRMKKKGIHHKDKKFKDLMKSDAYLNAIRAVYGYSLTCHKSQGGEWEEVYLYLHKSMYVMKPPGLYQWWYTATTRAKKTLFVNDDWFIS